MQNLTLSPLEYDHLRQQSQELFRNATLLHCVIERYMQQLGQDIPFDAQPLLMLAHELQNSVFKECQELHIFLAYLPERKPIES